MLEGVPEGGGGLIDLPLDKRSTRAEGWRMVPDPKGKPAQTRSRTIEQRGGRALVEFSPLSGRTHQIRVHAASGLGAAVVYDTVLVRGREGMLVRKRVGEGT